MPVEEHAVYEHEPEQGHDEGRNDRPRPER